MAGLVIGILRSLIEIVLRCCPNLSATFSLARYPDLFENIRGPKDSGTRSFRRRASRIRQWIVGLQISFSLRLRRNCSKVGRSEIIPASSMDTGLMSIPMKRRSRSAHSLAISPEPTKGSTTRSWGCVNFSTRKPRHSMGFLPQYLWNADNPVYPVGAITSPIDTVGRGKAESELLARLLYDAGT